LKVNESPSWPARRSWSEGTDVDSSKLSLGLFGKQFYFLGHQEIEVCIARFWTGLMRTKQIIYVIIGSDT
jgi:hypothetical protein